MTKDTILATLSTLATTGLIASACASNKPQSKEVTTPPGEPTTKGGDEQCLHTEGCCGGHAEGDSSCGADKAKKTEPAEGKGDDAAAAKSWKWTVEPGKFAEVNVELDVGAKMIAAFATDGADVAWNFHSHPGDKPMIHAKGNAKEGSPEFVAPSAGLYSVLWKNESKKPVELTVELLIAGQGKVHSTHP